MRYLLIFCCITFAFADWKTAQILAIDKIIQTYQNRQSCLQKEEAHFCIQKYPLDPKSDALAKTFAMSFPQAFYASKLQRDIKLLEKQKLCIGRALSEMEAKRCLTQF
ncbi:MULTISPECIES: hypothetical protein [Nitratiruptor]|uniref:Uncharacterized protein n=1 Tax=Nitratiruptor tergarcus DSM 16512 TaxID=1069081 RepID=A0A1W1WSR2_9BACT|nr:MULTISPECIES: hypothetical protein [Nitratiruptor]BCD61921.1 hypothetical protein NitYY0813_C0786 [Nitratiruptor sp. YY08-13]BCD65856.1 hypothetical protein NitYY0826_C0788 [Nitratiruptor sp. YY08-26]SMC09351.1 hypothetical protein SAMN05660197_1158 [Nitratiruptor tergarcus DSM 16512]